MDYKEKVMALLNSQELSKKQKEKLEDIFPELKESEDERIRKGLIKAVSGTLEGNTLWHTDVTREEALAWLEKQCEKKSFARYKVGDTIYYDSFGRLVSFTIANIVEDGTDNPMYEDKDGNSVFQNDIVEQKPEWSEEDEFLFNSLQNLICKSDIAADCANRLSNWLKSLKLRLK